MVQPGDGSRDTMAGVGEVSGETFQENQPEGVDVTRRAEVGAGDLFGAEVVGGAHNHPEHGDTGAIQQSRNPEVAELHGNRAGLLGLRGA